jgi:SAM-dependent methyltransferase
MKRIRRILIIGYSSLFIASVVVVAIMFPWSVDPQGDDSFQTASRSFYDKAYATDPQSGKEDVYKESAERATLITKTPKIAAGFVERYGLKDKKVLEVGAGSGLLQDIVEDYTALEISRSARRFFHKPFVEASATNMPFRDNTFDAIWSFRVLEHIPNPERALLEMRRVVKPGGYILLHFANDVDRYAAQGYRVRPYSDFDIWGRIKKATIPIADSAAFLNLYVRQVRLLRSLGTRIAGEPSRLRFIRLDANYDEYWIGDSDACISLSYHEALLWFTSRGDHCDNCPSEWNLVFNVPYHEPEMFIRVNKK